MDYRLDAHFRCVYSSTSWRHSGGVSDFIGDIDVAFVGQLMITNNAPHEDNKVHNLYN